MERWAAVAIALSCLACGRIGFAPSTNWSDAAWLDADPAITASFEAESGQLTAPFEIAPDPAASGGSYLLDNDPQGLGGPGEATYSFTADATRMYYVWGRTVAPDTSRDSFFLSLDGGADLNYDTSGCVHSDQWKWAVLKPPNNCPNADGPLAIPLTAGPHSLALRSREGLSAIDRVIISNDPSYVPAD